MAYSYAPIQQKTLPTMAEALKAYTQASKPKDADRDIRPLLAIEEQLPEADPRIDGLISARTAALTGFPWRIRAYDPKDEDAAEVVQARLADVVDELLDAHLSPVLFGHDVAKLQWGLDGQWIPSIEEFLDASDLEPMKDRTLYPGGIAQLVDAGGGKFTRNPLVTSPQTSYITERWGRKVGGIMKKIMFYQILLHMNIQDWSNFNKRLKGLSISKYKEGSDAGQIATAKAAGETIGQANNVVISDDIMFEFVKMVDGIGKDSYDQFMEKLDSRIEITFRGQANTTQLPDHGGSRAAIETSHLVEVDLLWSDMRRTMRKLNRQLLRQDYERNVNVLVPSRLPWVFEFITDEGEDFEANARTLETLSRAGFSADVEEVKRKTGWESLTLVKALTVTGF